MIVCSVMGDSPLSTGRIDLDALVRRLAARDETRTEANVQSGLHAFLLAAPLELEDSDLQIILEQQAGGGLRIDVEAGRCVFEVKRDLRRGKVRADAVDQLAGYVAARTRDMGQRYVGVLTDGAEWLLYRLMDTQLQQVSSFQVDPAKVDVAGLSVWLEGVLATGEQLAPTPLEISRRLGAGSPAYALDSTDVQALYLRGRDLRGVRLKRELWARLLTTAFGTGFPDTDELFINHTLLVVTAEIVAHAVMGLDPASPDLPTASILAGHLFSQVQVNGVVDADFFDWVLDVEGGDTFVRSLAQRLTRFAWKDVEHDVLKVLYESVISAAQRKSLGEYYTPDWLAHQVVETAVALPLKQRVLDPACGSGTFLFHGIRRYLAAADDAGLDNARALEGLTEHIIGMDIHPVAVTFARVTYLLAIGTARLQSPDRPPLSIPVYLGDSIQWDRTQTLFSEDAIVIQTTGSGLLFNTDLRFPTSVVRDAGRFDRLVAELAKLAANRPRRSEVPSIDSVMRRYSVDDAAQDTLRTTFDTMCQLHDNESNHIWGYYARNLARPFWLALEANRVDVLLGNPPWLSYRFMTSQMKKRFRALSEERGLWAGSAVSTNQDLSALFVIRAIERYLRVGGRFAFVMPWAVLRSQNYAGFRSGTYASTSTWRVTLEFDTSWDLHKIKPVFFPVPSCVVMGRRAGADAQATATPIAVNVLAWTGRLPRTNVGWTVAKDLINKGPGRVESARAGPMARRSPYGPAFTQGATVVPKVLFFVEEKPLGPLGAGAGRVEVRSRRSQTEKKPWKTLPAQEGSIERQFLSPIHVGDTILPYRTLPPRMAVLPWTGSALSTDKQALAMYPSFAEWWQRMERLWTAHRASDRLSLLQQLDYQKKLSKQLPVVPGVPRIVYSASGMYIAASLVRDAAVIEHKLYWGTMSSIEEARFLEALLNSDVLLERVRPLQTRGQHNPRDFDKYVWQLPIPKFDSQHRQHRRLSELAAAAEVLAAQVELDATKRFETLRRLVRKAVRESDVGQEIESLVAAVVTD